MKEKKKAKYINFIIISITLCIIMWIGISEYKNNHIEKKESEYITNNIGMIYGSNQEEGSEKQKEELNIKEEGSEKQKEELNIKEEEKETPKVMEKKEEYPKEEIIKEYRGYDVLAKLEIPAIELKTYILKNYSTVALNISVTKFWGANPNQVGNFCIAGHNFINNNMFRNLKKLEIGNTLTISDHNVGKVEYKIYNIYTVLPEDISCLSQETNGTKEVTLITCTSDSTKRIIVKAREIKT